MDSSTLRLEGMVIPFNVKNKNGRIYTKESFTPESLGDLQHNVKEGFMFGESSMPKDGRPEVMLRKVSHRVTDVSINNDGVYIGLEILDTPEGYKIREMIEAGIKMTVASRSVGSVDASGNVTIDQLISFDFVTDPAFDTFVKFMDNL